MRRSNQIAQPVQHVECKVSTYLWWAEMCVAKIKLAGLTTALDFYGTATSENVNGIKPEGVF